jgi:hypothetical protein
MAERSKLKADPVSSCDDLPEPRGLDFMIVDLPPTGVLRVVQLMLLGLLLGLDSFFN